MLKKCYSGLLMLLIPLFMSGGNDPRRLQDSDISVLLDGLTQRLENYPLKTHWDVRVNSVLIHMDKHWRPKKKITVEKILSAAGDVRSEKILSAREEEKGRVKDVTSKHQKDADKAAEKSRKNALKGKPQDEKRLELGIDQLFPFEKKQRGYYEFLLLGEQVLDERAVFVMKSRSYRKSRDFYEGTYYIDKATLDVLKVELRPAKFSGPLKKLEMVIEFDVIPGGHFVPVKTWAKLHVGLIVKNIRIEVTEAYSDYQIKQ